MPTQAKDQLFRLIKSLSKAEKRSFRLYANRTMSSQERKFLQLFDALDRLDDYQEEQLLERLPGTTKSQLSNLKRHLYKQILTSLRLIYIQRYVDIEIREQLDFARILYGKGMYMDALRLLERIKQTAVEHHQDVLHLEVLEFQKMIEARHITRSRQIDQKMDHLLVESTHRSLITLATSELNNLNIQIHGYYIEKGHAKTAAEQAELIDQWRGMQPVTLRDSAVGTFFEKVNLAQAHMWYHYTALRIHLAREHARSWVNLFELNEQMLEMDPDLYMRSLYYLLVFYFLEDNKEEYEIYLSKFEHFLETRGGDFNANSRLIAFVYFQLCKLNRFFLHQDYEGGRRYVQQILPELEELSIHMDDHRRMLFYYKFAYLSFAQGRLDEALEYLNEILTINSGFLREDIHYNALLLQILCHYELGNYDFLEYRLNSLRRLLNHGKEVFETQRLGEELLRALLRTPLAERRKVLENYTQRIAALQLDPSEQKALKYIDLPGWIDRQLNKTTTDLPNRTTTKLAARDL